MRGTPSVAVPGRVKGLFLPCSNPRSLLLFAQCPPTTPRPVPRPQHNHSKSSGASSGKIGARPDFLCGPAAPRVTRPSGLRGPRTARAAARARPPSHWASSATHRPPALSSRPLQLAPSQSVFQRKADASLPRGFRINRVLLGSDGRALGPRGLVEGGRGGAGEVFKLELEPPPRGSGSRGAVERPCASSGRDPRVWRGVGPWGRFAQNVQWLPGRGAAAALSQVGAAQRRGWPAL